MKKITARIYQPAKTAMQSGRARTGHWIVAYPRSAPARPDPLMGWQSSTDTARQIRLSFPDRQAAIDYCTAKGIDYQLGPQRERRIRPKAYADNFAFDRVGSWTH